MAVLKNFFCFLFYQISLRNQSYQLTNFLVLNSVSFFKKSRQLMEKYDQAHLYLDRDLADKKHALEALKWNENTSTLSHLYRQGKYLKDFLIDQNRQVNKATD